MKKEDKNEEELLEENEFDDIEDDVEEFVDDSDVEILKEKIQELEEKNKEIFAGWQRAEADFLNYKKRESERLGDINLSIKENIFEGLLPVLDNFNLAERAIPEDKKADNNIKGLLLIKKQMDYYLSSIGIQEIVTIGLPFNAEMCEAIEEVEVADTEAGIVVEEIQKGYKMGDKVIRPAKVKISK